MLLQMAKNNESDKIITQKTRTQLFVLPSYKMSVISKHETRIVESCWELN